jgi:hypothetical protein
MKNHITAKQIILKWPSRKVLAEDVSSITGRPLDIFAVHRWHQRNSIPAQYDAALIASACERDIDLSLVDLMGARSKHTEQSGHSQAKVQETTLSGSENHGDRAAS